jgi:hypothetical protein
MRDLKIFDKYGKALHIVDVISHFILCYKLFFKLKNMLKIEQEVEVNTEIQPE